LKSIEADWFGPSTELAEILAALATKRAVVLQGSPGTGKTYLAQKLAHHYAGSMERVHRVQFHPAYSYEDFVRGIRPTGTGFAVENGPLVRISEEARRAPREQFVLLIDEINRGNVAKILGEALSLIEVDKRDPKHKVKLGLALNGDYDFWIPPNVAILATMNTADRSIALVDYALRRRFAFIRLTPAYNRSEFKDWLLDQFSPGAGESLPSNDQSKAVALAITETMIAINEHIVSDKAFGDGFAIGHSFFCTYEPRHGEAPQRWANRVFEQEIGPLIEEYCVEHPSLRKKLLALVPNF
jgi:5-methylcytosine-specific restriction protein B